jgi:acetyltransferase-like isoleucine patch superfamily enzyme
MFLKRIQNWASKIFLRKIMCNLNNSFIILNLDESSILDVKLNVTTRKNCFIWIQGSASLSIGEEVFFNNNCSINCLDKIEIGSGTIFGEGVKLYDHNHKYTTNPIISISKDQFNTAPILIGKNCWIGSNVTILKGVTIGDNVIIGANCLIYESIPSNSIVKLNQSLTLEKKE